MSLQDWSWGEESPMEMDEVMTPKLDSVLERPGVGVRLGEVAGSLSRTEGLGPGVGE